MPPRPSVYVCAKPGCGHLLTRHRLIRGNTVKGPYGCRHCDCQAMQDDPFTMITVEQAQRHHAVEIRANRQEEK